MKVVLAEKPSVAKDLAKVLRATQRKDGYFVGKGYYITWAFGHLIRLANPDIYDQKYKRWRLEDLPILPSIFIKQIANDSGVKKQFKTIKTLFNDSKVAEIICATDAGREGELIFRFIYELSKCKKDIKRLWISSQTDKAILEGFSNLKPGVEYDPLFDSALCRAEADWLIGMNASRAYTIKYSQGRGVMSVGRVQTPVLKMIVDRHHEHVTFKPQTYYEIFIDILHPEGEFMGKWFTGKEDRFSDKDKAQAVLETVQQTPQGKITKVTKKEKKENQPLLYDLTELQKDANKRYKFSADKTLKIAQSLYDKHKVLTYPRTSSRFLSADMVPKLSERLQNLKGIKDYSRFSEKILEKKLNISKRIVNDAKVTDHHAIIPTDKKAVISALSPDEFKVFDLVIKRFLAVFLELCIKNQTQIITAFGDQTFKAAGSVMKQQGWREVYLKDSDKKDEEETTLPDVKKGDQVIQKNCKIEEKQTKAPPLYNEASILASMETAGKQIEDEELREAIKDSGLGTPATRAQILERLIKVGYIVREKHKLVPTEKGQLLISYIQDKELLSPELTGEWEKKLNDMAHKKYSRNKYIEGIKAFTNKIVQNVKESDYSDTQNVPNGNAPNAIVTAGLGKCPSCGGAVVENKKAYGCSNWRSNNCKFAIWKTIAGKTITETTAKKLLDEGKTTKLKGFKSKTGKTFDAFLILKNNKVEFKF